MQNKVNCEIKGSKKIPGADLKFININHQEVHLLERVSRSGNLPTIKTEDSRQTGTESRVTGRENQVPPAIRRWVPPSLRPQHGLTEADKNDAIFRKVCVTFNYNYLSK